MVEKKMMHEAAGKVTDKLPTFEQYSKNTRSSVSYIFMLIFFIYFIYNEFVRKDDCGQRVATLERVLTDKDDMINMLNNRVSALEVALDVRNGVLRQVEAKADSLSKMGGQK